MEQKVRVFVANEDHREEVSKRWDAAGRPTEGYQGFMFSGGLTHVFFFGASEDLIQKLIVGEHWKELNLSRSFGAGYEG